jgi:hypothetical protein
MGAVSDGHGKGCIWPFPKWKKYREKWSPDILADYCWSLVRNKLAKVKYKRE